MDLNPAGHRYALDNMTQNQYNHMIISWQNNSIQIKGNFTQVKCHNALAYRKNLTLYQYLDLLAWEPETKISYWWKDNSMIKIVQ